MTDWVCKCCGRPVPDDEVPTFEELCRECARYQEQLRLEEWAVYGELQKEEDGL